RDDDEHGQNRQDGVELPARISNVVRHPFADELSAILELRSAPVQQRRRHDKPYADHFGPLRDTDRHSLDEQRHQNTPEEHEHGDLREYRDAPLYVRAIPGLTTNFRHDEPT